MSRRPTKPQLRRRSWASPLPDRWHFTLPVQRRFLPAFGTGRSCPPHSRGPKARAGPTSRSPAWGPAPGCSGGSGRSVWLWGAGSVREPALLPLSSRRRSRTLPPLAGSSGGGPSRLCFGCLCFCDPCPPQPSRTRGPFCSAQPVAQTSGHPPPDVTGHSSLPGTGAPRRRREKMSGPKIDSPHAARPRPPDNLYRDPSQPHGALSFQSFFSAFGSLPFTQGPASF